MAFARTPLRLNTLFVLIFLLCFCTKTTAQDVDSLILNRISSELYTYLKSNQLLSKPISIKTADTEQKIFFESYLSKQQISLAGSSSESTLNVEVSHKGKVQFVSKYVSLLGVLLVRVDSLNQLIQSKRIPIDSKMSISNIDPSTLTVWELDNSSKQKSKSGLKVFLEPAMILITMGISVYLLYAVRS